MIETEPTVREVRNYVDGGWVEANGATFESTNPIPNSFKMCA